MGNACKPYKIRNVVQYKLPPAYLYVLFDINTHTNTLTAIVTGVFSREEPP